MNTKNCTVCNKVLDKKDYKYRFTKEQWNKKKYCSFSCYRKVPRSEDIRKKISEGNKRNGVGKWMTGRTRPIELRIKQSQKMKERVASGQHNFWKGGISKHTRDFKSNFQNTIEYKLWRTAVFQRDNYTCIWCGARNGNGKKIELNADHIHNPL
jgi:hypothetical protein